MFEVLYAHMQLGIFPNFRVIQNLIGLFGKVGQELLCLFQNFTLHKAEVRLFAWFSKQALHQL